MKKQKVKQADLAYEISGTNQRMLNYRIYLMKPGERALYFALAFVVGAAVAYLFYGGIGKDAYGDPTMLTHILDISIMLIVGTVAGLVFVPIRRGQLIEERRKLLRAQFISLLDSLSTSISAGKNVQNAFTAAREDLLVQYDKDAFIIQEVDNILSGIRNGLNVGAMLLNFGERSGIQDIRTFGRVFEIAANKGANLKDVLRNCHTILSSKVEIEMDIETKVASNKNEQRIMLIMPIVLIAMLKLSGSDFADNFTTPTGILSTTLAIVLFVGAYFLGRQILKIEV